MGIFSNLFGKKTEPTSNSSEQNNFVLSEIERKTISGRNYVVQYVNFKGQKLPIVGIVSELNPNFVEYSSKRPKEMQPPNGQLSFSNEISEFFTDLLTINQFLNNESNLTDDSFFKVAEHICNQHIKRAGRLIDTDMYTYVDFIIFAKYGIWDKLHKYQLTDEETSKLWIQLASHCRQRFENYIFVTKYDMSNPLLPKPYLTKLKN